MLKINNNFKINIMQKIKYIVKKIFRNKHTKKSLHKDIGIASMRN